MINLLIMLGIYTGVGLLIVQQFNQPKSNWQKRIGESFFVGVFVVVVINNLSQYFDLNLNQKYFFYSLMLISSITIIFYLYQHLINYSGKQYKLNIQNFNQLNLLIFFIIIVHLYFIIEQNKLLPLTPWDAWSAWVAKSKIWHAFGINQLIVNQFSWFEIVGSMTNQAEHYPDGLSLLYTFNAGFFGWNETDLNSIYPAMLIALLLLFYGNIKILTNEKYALLSLAVLVTLPFVNVHIVLAGYADIWVATFMFIVLLNIQQYILKKSFYNLAMIWANIVLMIMFKQEAIIWVCIILSTIVMTLLTKFKRRITYLLLLVLTIIWYFVGGFQIDFPFGKLAITPSLIIFPGLGKYTLTFVNTMPAWIEAMFFSKNWHLLWYSLPVVFGLYLKVDNKKLLALPIIFLVQASMFLFVLFSMSYATIFASSFTSINRMVLHIVPIYIYFLIQVVYQYQAQKTLNN